MGNSKGTSYGVRRADFEQHEVPHPDAVAAAKRRLASVQQLVFELELGSWRSVWLTEGHPVPNAYIPALSVILYKPVLLVATPYMPTLDFYVGVTKDSLRTKRCSILHADGKHGGAVGFRCANDEAEAWLTQKLAQAAGMRFREHNSVKPDELVYTK